MKATQIVTYRGIYLKGRVGSALPERCGRPTILHGVQLSDCNAKSHAALKLLWDGVAGYAR
jgi:hypothetical protein